MKFSFSSISLFVSFFIFLYVRIFYFLLESWSRNLCLVNPGACFNNYPFPGISIFHSIEPFIIVFNSIHYSDSILWQWFWEELNRDPTNCKTLFCFCWNRVRFSENYEALPLNCWKIASACVNLRFVFTFFPQSKLYKTIITPNIWFLINISYWTIATVASEYHKLIVWFYFAL